MASDNTSPPSLSDEVAEWNVGLIPPPDFILGTMGLAVALAKLLKDVPREVPNETEAEKWMRDIAEARARFDRVVEVIRKNGFSSAWPPPLVVGYMRVVYDFQSFWEGPPENKRDDLPGYISRSMDDILYDAREVEEATKNVVVKMDDAKRKLREAAAFIPNTMQEMILRALDGQSATGAELQTQLCGSKETLYGKKGRGGLTELRKLGFVKKISSKGGYYRPDRPPEWKAY